MQKTIRILAAVFLALGLVFAAVAAGLGLSYFGEIQNMEPVDAVVVSVTSRTTTVSYTVDGQLYESVMNLRSSSLLPGFHMTVMVDPDDPAHYGNASFHVLTLIFGVIGGAFVLTGVILIAVKTRMTRRRDDLLAYGLRVSAEVTDVRVNYAIRMGVRHPVIVYATCTHPVTHEHVDIRSQSVFCSSVAAGDRVDVLFDPHQPEKYFFDLAEDAR